MIGIETTRYSGLVAWVFSKTLTENDGNSRRASSADGQQTYSLWLLFGPGP